LFVLAQTVGLVATGCSAALSCGDISHQPQSGIIKKPESGLKP